ncbi:MFS transporter [Glaciecola sp. 1036]|uniref:MFS transporter n=1 Tax=Alteromonadaceae TaxID=72275 RepID=UPI003D05CD64
MENNNQQLSVLEKVGYSLGDFAANLVFQTLVTFIAFYYTDVFRIPTSSATSIIFICGLLGAFAFNPIIGILADRTKTRWGKFRPWILWTSVPFGVLSLLAFTTPDFDTDGKVIYAFVTYLLLLFVYSANNLPYAALSGVITGKMKDRNSMSSYRFVAVMIAQFIIQALLLPLVLVAGDGDKAAGFEIVMTYLAIIGTVCFIITFLTTKERVLPVSEKASTIKEDLQDLVTNVPWIIMLVVTVLVFITLALKGGTYVYYFKDYADKAEMVSFLEAIGFNSFIAGVQNYFPNFFWPDDPATSAFSLFNASGIIFMIIGIFFSKSLADKFGKRNVFGLSLFVSTIFILAFYFYPKDAIGTMFTSQILHGFFYGISTPLLWAMIADVADFSEWKTNRRATAIIFSAMIMGLKVGLTLGSALVTGILDSVSYNPDLVTQSAETVNGIKLAVSVYAAIPFLIACACLFAYKINKSMENTIESDLAERRAQGASVSMA